MVRIEAINIPDDKQIQVSLTHIYGIGRRMAMTICKKLNIDPYTKTANISEKEVAAIRDYVAKTLKVEGDLRREVTSNIKRLQEIGTYRGYRHRRHLPSRGQKTKTNARTRRGKKKVGVGSGRRKESKT